jgi:hypothetical protein
MAYARELPITRFRGKKHVIPQEIGTGNNVSIWPALSVFSGHNGGLV